MHPTLFTLPLGLHGIAVPAFGAMVALGTGLGLWLALRESRRVELASGAIFQLYLWTVLVGLLGARLLFVLLHAGDYLRSCSEPTTAAATVLGCSRALHLWEGGLALPGGLVAGGALAVFYARRLDLPRSETLDLLAPSVALALFFGRLGCYLAGCCYGQTAHGPVGVRFAPASVAYHQLVSPALVAAHSAPDATAPLHPTQLYLAGAMLGLFVLLLWVRANKRFHGQVALVLLGVLALVTTPLELFRGDLQPLVVLPLHLPTLHRWLGLAPATVSSLTLSQLLNLLLLLGSGWLYLRGRRAHRSHRT